MRIAAHHKIMIWAALSLGCGLIAAWSGTQYLEQQRQLIVQSNQQPMVERIVAAYTLSAGDTISESHLAVRAFPAHSVASDSYEPTNYKQLLGKTLYSNVAVGDMLLAVHASQVHKDAFSTRLLPGRRAVTMPVDQINALAGLLQTGDLVDLYVSFDHQRRKITAPLLQGVLVLATDEHTDSHGELSGSYSTVTLDLAPEDGAKLVAARQTGTITAMLRNPNDAQLSSKAVRGDLASLLGVNTVATEYKTIPVIYGNKAQRQLRATDATPAAARSAILDVLTPKQLSAIQGDDDAMVD